MSAEPGGIASKRGLFFERFFAVAQLVRLVQGELTRVRWEPASGEAGGADVEIVTVDGLTEHVQLKRQNGARGKWTVKALNREGVLRAAARTVDASAGARFTFVSADPVDPHLRDICEQLGGNGDADEELVRRAARGSVGRSECFDELLRAWALPPGGADAEALAVRRLRAMSFELHDGGDAARRALALQLRLTFVGDPDRAADRLAALLESRLARSIAPHDVLEHLARHGIAPQLAARDPALPAALAAQNRRFIASLRSRLVEGSWIARAEVAEIASRATDPAGPRAVLVHGPPGAGKSGILLGVAEELSRRGVPLLALSLDLDRPAGGASRFGKALGLGVAPAAALRAVAGDRRAVLLVDQLDAMRLASERSAADWAACAEVLREAADDPGLVLVAACRTFDLEHDENIRRWRDDAGGARKGRIEPVRIGDLAEPDVARVVRGRGVDLAALPPRLRRLLRHPASLEAWHRLPDASSRGGEFATQTELLRAVIGGLRARAAREYAVADRDVGEALALLLKRLRERGLASAPESALQSHRAAIDACCGVGLLVRIGRAVGFPHQSYHDHLVAADALGRSGHSPAAIVDWVRRDQSLGCRDQVRNLLFLQHAEEPAAAARTAEALLRSGGVRFHLKLLVLGVLREARPVGGDAAALVARLALDAAWAEHVHERVLRGSLAWFDALAECGAWEAILARSRGEERARWLWTVLRSARDRPREVDRLLEPVLAEPGGDPIGRAAWLDPAEDSPALAAWRDARVRAGAWWLDEDALDRVAALDARRAVRLLDSLVRGRLRRVLATLAEGAGEAAAAADDAFGEGIAAAVRAADDSFPVLGRLIRLGERIHRRVRRGEPSEGPAKVRSMRVASSLRDLLDSLESLASHAVAGLAERDLGALRRTIEAPGLAASASLTRAVAAGLGLAPDAAADVAIGWLASDPARLLLEPVDDPWGVSEGVVRRHAAACSPAALGALEAVLLSFVPEQERRGYEREVRGYAAASPPAPGGGRPPRNRVGQCQRVLLEAIPEARRSGRVRERLGVWEGKFGPVLERRRLAAAWGLVGSPVPRARVSRVGDAQWLDIVSRRWPQRWRHAGPGRFAEASPEHFADDMAAAAAEQPARFVRLAMRFPAGAPAVYLARLWSGLTRAPDGLGGCSAAELDTLADRTAEAGDAAALMAACGAIERHPGAPWGAAVWRLVEAATAHRDPAAGSADPDAAAHDLESTSLNSVRGAAASALAALSWDDAERSAVAAAWVGVLADDAHPAVRAAAARAAYAIYGVDRDAGVGLLLRLAAGADDRALACRWPNQLVGYARWSHPDELGPLMERMARSGRGAVARMGARWVAAERFQRGACLDAYGSCRAGTVHQRRGAAETLGELLVDESARGEAAAIAAELAAFLDDPDPEVRAAAARALHVDGVLESGAGPGLTRAFVRSAAFAEHAHHLLHRLGDAPVDLRGHAEAVLACADRFAAELAERTRSHADRLGMAGRDLAPLLLRLHHSSAKAGDAALAEACLDRWDALLSSRVGEAEMHLDAALGDEPLAAGG